MSDKSVKYNRGVITVYLPRQDRTIAYVVKTWEDWVMLAYEILRLDKEN